VRADPSANDVRQATGSNQAVAQSSAVNAPEGAATNSAAQYQPDCREPRDEAEFGACAQAGSIAPAWFEVGGLLLTLVFTGWAARAAGRSAKAAEIAIGKSDEILTHAKESSERELRAYVFAFSAYLLEGSLAKPVIKHRVNKPGVQFTIRNSGHTPAYEVIYWGDIKIIECRYEDTALPIPNPLSVNSKFAMPPSGDIHKTLLHPNALTPTEIAGIKNNTIAVYVYGRVEYKDAFKVPRFTNYRLKYSGLWPPNSAAMFLFCEHGNESD
jgi:hypothetical protein